MINNDVPLYQEHSERVIHVPGKSMSPGRDPFVLDFSNP
ncbi:hypothetical protein ACO1PF_05375 [Alkalibacterium sp. f15]